MAPSENIKARRTQIKVSQKYVVDQLGINRQTATRWEAGTSGPTSRNLSKLVSLSKMSVSGLVGPQTYAEEQETQEQKLSTKQRSAKILSDRWGAVILMNADRDGYSSGLYGTGFPYYWLAISAVGLVLLFIASKDMEKKHKLEVLQVILGLSMIFSVFFLPRIIPLKQVGVTYLLADVITAICAILLSLKY